MQVKCFFLFVCFTYLYNKCLVNACYMSVTVVVTKNTEIGRMKAWKTHSTLRNMTCEGKIL